MPMLNRTRTSPGEPAALSERNGKPAGLPRAPGVEPPGRRRRPRLAAVGVAVVMLGGLLGAFVYAAAGDRAAVIAVASPVAFGEQLGAEDLVRVELAEDPGLQPVPYADLDQVVGMTAATDLIPGSLLTMAALTAEAIPGAGQELVPIALQTSQLPAIGLQPRDEVLLVATAGDGQGSAPAPGGVEPATGAGEGTSSGMVLRVGRPTTTGVVVVDVLVESGAGAGLARLAAAGRLALVVLPREG